MVRLKALLFFSNSANFKISIPYGAIKSIKKRLKTNCLQIISIPYGAIKR